MGDEPLYTHERGRYVPSEHTRGPWSPDHQHGGALVSDATATPATPADHNVAALHEAIAAAVPDRDCIVWRGRAWSWAEVTDRSRRLAAVLTAAGVGPRALGPDAARWESPHEHVALYLHNGNEYLEGMLGAWKARAAPFNVNYRYVASELAYLLADSRVAAVVYHGAFAETLAEVLPDLPAIRLLLQVDDGSGAPLLPGALAYEDALAAAAPGAPQGLSPDDRYILYTGGTTGMPKGVLWRQGDFLATCLGVRRSVDDLVAAAGARSGLRTLPSAPLMHGAAHWNALSAWMSGGTVVFPDDTTRLDPADVLGVCEREAVSALQIVGDAFARPLLDELDAHSYDLSGLRFLLSGGAALTPPIMGRFVAAVPGLRVVDVLGSSETGRQAVTQTRGRSGGEGQGGDVPGGFVPEASAVVLSDDRSRRLAPGDPDAGWLAQAGRVPLGYLGDEAKTEATFPVVDGVRFAVSGDRVRVLPDGRLDFLGRESVTINTGGEKVFAEEVETAVTSHPAVADAIVVGRPDPRWGQEVVAVVAFRPGERPADGELKAHLHRTLAGYKVPKAFVPVDRVVRSPAGKPDYGWARSVAVAAGSAGAVEPDDPGTGAGAGEAGPTSTATSTV
jgi:fatty-acyl-CoA synthase